MLHRYAACAQRQGTFQGADDRILCLPSQSQLFRAVPGFLVQFGINLDRKKNEKWAETIADDPFPVHVGLHVRVCKSWLLAQIAQHSAGHHWCRCVASRAGIGGTKAAGQA